MTPITPTWAAKVWLEGRNIYATLPMPDGEQEHTLCFPNDQVGLSRLLFLIQNRSSACKLNEPGDITQHKLDRELLAKQADDWLKANKPKKARPESNSAVRGLLQKMGMLP